MQTVEEVDNFVAKAHAGQVDRIGVPYVEHVRAVAAGLAPFGPELVMAGLLHDVIEDTDWTARQLMAVGVPAHVVSVVETVTNQPGVPYGEKIKRITGNRDATLVKIADNAHNSHPDRIARLPAEQRDRLAAKYRQARDTLWAAADGKHIEVVLSIVNPSLIAELCER
ncbi:HD domain-containing protein [Streptomyces sp. NPDC002573]|uniref:HD domain-containing protein n=1 Tax=Streptomyces sp. NPDC002573 TaxID=3364651 RepID=UPI0036AE24E6